MNVYIYGNNSFKKDIHDTLEHANLKFKLDSDSVIKDINSLEELKTIIKQSPDDIYLIDDDKIIKKDGISKKLKFLTPKDGIEEEYLLDHGIADLSVDSLKDIPKYIIEKHDQQKANSQQDIQSSIEDIVDDAYNEDNNYYDDINLDKKQNQDSSSDDEPDGDYDEDYDDGFELDDELAALLEKSDDDVGVEVVDNKQEDKVDDILDFDDVGLNNSEFDYDDKSIINDEDNQENSENSQDDDLDSLMNELDSYDNSDSSTDYDEPIDNKHEQNEEENQEDFFNDNEQKNDTMTDDNKGAKMSDDFAELDGLNEKDILSALDGLDEIKISNEKSEESPSSKSSDKKESLEINSSNSQDIVQLLTKLLNNKTLEITVKIKD
ncbi:MAG: hypothetical protein ACQERD_06705 [Campylobacterota bacterium]